MVLEVDLELHDDDEGVFADRERSKVLFAKVGYADCGPAGSADGWSTNAKVQRIIRRRKQFDVSVGMTSRKSFQLKKTS